ncbi:MAG: DHH family phosphoesterase [Oscillospiraceae bacterium]|nr:DHH family phosphoesterase [Oscillospiraceae bacterium]
MRLYYLLLIVFAVSTFFIGRYSRILAAVQVGVLIILAIYSRVAAKNRTRKLLDYLESMSDGMDTTVRDTPLPVVVYNTGTNEIIWSNDRFISITNSREQFFDRRVSDVVPGYTGDWLLDGKSECPDIIRIGEQEYRVYGSMVRSDREYIATIYLIDVSDYLRISREYHDSRLIFAIMLLDNYEELLRGMSEKDKSTILSNLDEKISNWAGDKGGYLCKYDRDRYFFLFEERHLQSFIDDNFSLLDTVRAETGAENMRATMSIGIGKDGATPQENYRFASLAAEMALSRGGDQAVIRNMYGFEFFGGHSPQTEKRTRVKSRVMASAFGELLADASTVYIMGHKSADYDSIGSAIGVCCIARAKGKVARIVTDSDNSIAHKLIEYVTQLSEYRGVFITEQDAVLEADNKSLLVIVDTNRPDLAVSQTLLLSCSKIAVIDHHRRAADYIDNAVLNFHETSASSTCELVAELMQYLTDRKDVLREEAGALLVGIMLDTKGFSINIGAATFDAAAFLRRAGADAVAVKRIMQSDINVATARYEIMRCAEIYRDGVALAASEETMSRVSVAQAADGLLDINGVHTSFAASRDGDDVFVSGRSLGGINVQVVLEKLGGGGSQSVAGLRVRSTSIEKVMADLKKAIDEAMG